MTLLAIGTFGLGCAATPVKPDPTIAHETAGECTCPVWVRVDPDHVVKARYDVKTGYWILPPKAAQ